MGIKNYSKSQTDNNLKEVIYLLNTSKINYWLCQGTLLGIIRDNELIPWDHDIDIAVWKQKGLKEKFKKIMKENNYQLKNKYVINDDLLTFIKNGGREVDINFYEKKNSDDDSIAFVRWFVPKNFLMKLVEAISESNNYSGKGKWLIRKFNFCASLFTTLRIKLIEKNKFYKQIGYTTPYKLLKEFKDLKFKDIIVRIPRLSEEYLQYVYGKNWKKPLKDYNWVKDSPSTKEIK